MTNQEENFGLTKQLTVQWVRSRVVGAAAGAGPAGPRGAGD